MKRHHRWPVLPALAALSAGLLAGCGTGEEAGDNADSTVVVGMTDDVLATDPASGYDPGSWLLFNNVFQSLLSFPRGGIEPKPEAAEECHFTDGQTQVFECTLRDGLEFSNGDPFTSEDVKFTFDRMLKINDPSGPAVMFASLDKIETPDEKTVVFKLKFPDATFPSKIASGAGSIVPRGEYPADKLREDGEAVGSGPYQLDSFDEEKAVFSLNTGYKGTAETRNAGVTLQLFRGDRAALKTALTEGEVDVAYRGLAASDIADIEENSTGDEEISVLEGNSAEVQHLVFNVKDPVVGNPGVRKAIAYLLDREALIDKVYEQTATPLYSIVPAGITGHNTAFFDTYGGKPSKTAAAQALTEAGVTDKVKLTLWSTPDRYGPSTDDEFEAIAEQLNSSGLFDAQVKSVKFDQYEKDIADGKYGVYVKGWVPDYPDPENFTGPFFGEGNVLGNNYENETITEDLVPATAAQRERSATANDYGQLQDIVAEELPILPVWQAKQYAVVRDGVYGLEKCLDASTVFRFWEISKSG
ncbi:ABC transporter substrate-binding protein [Streptomyces abyssomicinicus]|uniref:ABC transporter substrate-binding protein n=1 Tax=Streptomyces abyssomicinicus TaxID=574929 RepID=UPI001250A8D0|nr:ABC transporter substrate-binding protein [Streptomyces abyssomicinicus]